MLPYASGGYGYGRRKGFWSSPSTLIAAVTALLLAALGFAAYTHFRASALYSAKIALQRDLDSSRSELYSLKSQYSSRNADLEQLQVTHGHAQRRLTEISNQLQRKEAEVLGNQQLIKERTLAEQHRAAREAELTKMVEDLRAEIMRTDGIIAALDKKVATMEEVHGQREKDWHKLAGTWVKYEQDLHEQYRKCTDEVAKLRNQTVPVNDTAPLPEAEPKLRAETDFGHINVQVPEHKAHTFDPLAPPTPAAPTPAAATTGGADLPLPEAKIRDSIVQMTGGKVGLEPGQAMPSPLPSPSPSPAAVGEPQQQQHEAPTPMSAHHHDVYHGDFHGDEFHDHYHQQYDHYHGHYDSYDPMDQYWMRDAHGDWNADEHPGGADDIANHHNDQHGHDNHHNNHHDIHNQHDIHHNTHDNHHNTHDIHHQKHPDDIHDQHHRYHYQEQHQQHQQQHVPHAQHAMPGGGVPDPHQYHHQMPSPMAGIGTDAHQHEQQPPQQPVHAQHAPSRWHYDHHEQQQQQHQHQQAPQQQYQQQQQEQHQQHQQHQQQHPSGDLAYKMGW